MPARAWATVPRGIPEPVVGRTRERLDVHALSGVDLSRACVRSGARVRARSRGCEARRAATWPCESKMRASAE